LRHSVDTTRWAAVNSYDSACCDLDLSPTTFLPQNVIGKSMNPNTSVTKTG